MPSKTVQQEKRMSKRINVVVCDSDYEEIEKEAKKRGVTISSLIRTALKALLDKK